MAFRMVQELVTNALKHAQAHQIKVSVSHVAQVLKIQVEDDGIGLPENPEFHTGRGLENIQTQASLFGGQLSLERGQKGKGTRISIVLPTETGENAIYPASLN